MNCRCYLIHRRAGSGRAIILMTVNQYAWILLLHGTSIQCYTPAELAQRTLELINALIDAISVIKGCMLTVAAQLSEELATYLPDRPITPS